MANILQGGHVSTYDDPATGLPFDFGVQSFNNYGPAAAFMQRLGISTIPAPRVTLTQRFVDFKTGSVVPYVPSSAADRTSASTSSFGSLKRPST